MDCLGTRSGRLIAIVLASGLLLAAGAALATGRPIAALRWTAPEALPLALSQQPAECLTVPQEPVERARVEVGRAAFRTPLLLGGQAARLGLSCESCHSNGRVNRAFQFPGLSGAPGSADVTSALMSTHRGNAVFDPRPIPDLASPGKVDRDPDQPALRQFIRGLIVEEFDGREPPPAVLDGLTAYVGAITAKVCPQADPAPVTASQSLDSAGRAMTAAGERWRARDVPATLLMLDAARAALSHLAERYTALPHDQARLIAADARIARIAGLARRGDRGTTGQISDYLKEFDRLRITLLQDEAKSLFNPDRLAESLVSSPAAR